MKMGLLYMLVAVLLTLPVSGAGSEEIKQYICNPKKNISTGIDAMNQSDIENEPPVFFHWDADKGYTAGSSTKHAAGSRAFRCLTEMMKYTEEPTVVCAANPSPVVLMFYPDRLSYALTFFVSTSDVLIASTILGRCRQIK